MNTCAILPVDKPAGWTSFDVLAKLRGALGTRRLGHAGTLDPMATGVLAVFIGNATAAADRQPDHDKTYEATIRLGLRTDTGDVTGTALETAPVTVGEAELKAVLPQFMGRQMQLPPMYSAVKINGQPLYKAARKGQTVERTPRPITIYEITYLGSPAPGDYTIRVSCSKGTYIRVLAEDIGTALGVPATLAALRRTRAGAFKIEECHTLPEILAAAEAGTLQQSGWLQPLKRCFFTASSTVRAGSEANTCSTGSNHPLCCRWKRSSASGRERLHPNRNGQNRCPLNNRKYANYHEYFEYTGPGGRTQRQRCGLGLF